MIEQEILDKIRELRKHPYFENLRRRHRGGVERSYLPLEAWEHILTAEKYLEVEIAQQQEQAANLNRAR